MAFKPNRDLLNVNFEGYKLSETPLSFSSGKLAEGVHVAKMKEEDFSFQHTRAYSLHNHLVVDPYNNSSVYWFGKDGSIQQGRFQDNVVSFNTVYTGIYIEPIGSSNATVIFLNEFLSVFCNGGNELILFNTGKRDHGSAQWKIITKFEAAEKNSVMIVAAALALDGRSADVVSIELLDPSKKLKQNTTSPVTNYRWHRIKFTTSISEAPPPSELQIENVSLVTSFESRALALYAVFQRCCDASTYLLLLSDAMPSTQQEMVEDAVRDDHFESDPQEHHFGLGYNKPSNYKWNQSESDVVISFELPKDVTKKEIDCVIESHQVVVGLTDGTTFFRGGLYAPIDPDASAWTIENKVLEVTLEKKDGGVQWPCLLKEEQEKVTHRGDDLSQKELQKAQEMLTEMRSKATNDSECKNSPSEEEQQPPAKKLRPLVSENLEDCDTSDEDSSLFVIAENGTIIQRAGLGGHQLVFTSLSSPDLLPYFALRHDVDGIIWQPDTILTDPTKPSWHHKTTFNALAYIQASKEDRKFTMCPPSLKYAAISDCSRHIFIYLQPEDGLKGNKASENVHTLSSPTEILGLQATDNGALFVLTPDELIVLNIPT